MRFVFMLMLIALLATACGPTGNTANDAVSAQTLLPNITGYTRTDTTSVQDALVAAGSGAALSSGNAPVAAAVVKIDDMVDCMREVGAVAANTYVETSPSSIIPIAGVVAVINQTRVESNLLSCAISGNQGFSAQGVTIEPCAGNGSFTFRDNEISYIYAATNPSLCETFSQHFTNVEQNQ